MQSTAAVRVPKALASSPLSRVVKAVSRPSSLQKSAKELALAGHYRVIHGSVEIVRPYEEWHNPDGSVNENEPKTARASCVITYDAEGKFKSAAGDEVWLNDEDAYRLLAMSYPNDVSSDDPLHRDKHAVVETLDAKPSRCGKVWKPPPVTQRA